MNPLPALSSLSPVAVYVGSGDTRLTVTGTGFAHGSVVEVGGTALPTVYWNPTALTATVPAALLQIAANLPVLVTTPAPGGGTSSAVTFAVMNGVFATKNPQVAMYAFSTTQAASVSVEFGTDTTYGLHTWAQTTPQGGGAVQMLVAGMRANTTYHMRADVTYADGTQAVDEDRTFTTGGLPADRVPQITVTNPNGLTPTPGVIFLHIAPPGGPARTPTNRIRVVVVDNAGNVIWYYDTPAPGVPSPVKLLPNGHVLMNLGGVGAPGTVQEIDLAGNVISQFAVTDLNNWLSAGGFNLSVSNFGPDLVPLPNGHMILMVSHVTNCTEIPGCVGTDNVTMSALVDLDRNHKPVWVWDSLDHLCPPTPTSPCLDINRRLMGWPDWMHSNALAYSPDDGNLLLSTRHQFCVIKIDYQDGQGSGDILWRLGPEGDFTLTNGGIDDWFYAQHYLNIVSPNSAGVFNLMVFDNGNNRGIFDVPSAPCGTPGHAACYSTVPIFQVDEGAMTATILWHDNLAPVYGWWAGSAQLLDDNRVVFCIGSPSDDPMGSRYMEVTYDPSPQIVLRMEVSGQSDFRMVHLPSLYPGVQW
jgi:hypothetical protein